MRAHPDWLKAALRRIDPQTPCVASRILDWEGERIDYNGSSLQYLGYALQQDIGELARQVSFRDKVLFPCGGATVIERSFFLELGGFDPDFFAIFEDVDLGWRIWLSGKQVAFAPESVVYHRGHSSFQTRPNEKMRYLMHRNALLTILKNYQEGIFERILPLAVVMAVKRAVHFSGVRKESFYLWEQTRASLDWGDPATRERLLDALNHLVALDDILEMLPAILAKRKVIQARRKRSDSEILEWFTDPLRPIVEDPSYVYQEQDYLERLDLSSLLNGDQGRGLLDRLPEQLAARIARRQAELKAQQWLQGYSFRNPPLLDQPGLGRFLKIWRQQGLRVALKRFVEHVDRGI